MLLYISGPHGAGKTTLINRLLDYDYFRRASSAGWSIPDRSAYERASIRTIKYLLEKKENKVKSKSTKHMLLADRGIYDTICYVDAYFKMGWLSEDQYKTLKSNIDHLFFHETKNNQEKVVLLIPDKEHLYRRLQQRALNGSHRWMQENRVFCDVLHDCYIDNFVKLEERKTVHVIRITNNETSEANAAYIYSMITREKNGYA